MPTLDDYITDTLMRDLVGHDRKPVSFLVYLWLAAEHAKTRTDVPASYQHVAESMGISKSSAQAAIVWLLKRKLLAVRRVSVTATPVYTVRSPWREAARRLKNYG
jgi:hypothetical protein